MSFHPIPGETYTFYLPGLEDQANAGLWKSSPTIAAGDFTISINGGAFGALDNTPTVSPAGGTQIEIVLSAAETTAAGEGGSITVNCQDAAGDEWYSVGVTLRVGAPAVNVTTWKGDAVADLVGGEVKARLQDKRISGFIGAANLAQATFLDSSFTAAQIGQTVIPFDVGVTYDNQFRGWSFIIQDGNSSIYFASVVIQSSAADNTLTILDPIHDPGFELEDPVPYMLVPIPAIVPQGIRDAMKLAPTAGDPAAGSVDKHLDDILTAAAAIQGVTDELDVSAVTQVAASSAGHLTITAGLTFDEDVTGLTIPADWAAAVWTLKHNVAQADTAAVIQLRATNPADGDDGLQRLNGVAVAAPITAADGVLTVEQGVGRIGLYLSDELTLLLAKATGLGWDIKFIDEDGDSTGRRGTADVVLTETQAVV